MIRERQRTVALLSVANVSSRVPSDWWKPRVVRSLARASAGESEGKSICARSLFIEGNCAVAFTCASSSPETVERFPKGKLSGTVEDNPPRRTKYRGRTRETRVCPDDDAVYPLALWTEDEGPERWEREEERRRFVRRVEKLNASLKSRLLIRIGLTGGQTVFCAKKFALNLFQLS